MSLPPSLLYLVIYNPSLQPTQPTPQDEDDAKEQAHILFYTGKQHAVSRDKMLRQVGLAKALVNFSSMFASHPACESVHSQTRRMIMVSPEQDFWMHACVELGKNVRPPEPHPAKGKVKHAEPTYDYSDATVQDAALQTQLLRAYESFKITHGSFTTILESRGKEALELQLERFFTVWAWSWDLDNPMMFHDYLGVPVHPLSNQLLPAINDLRSELPKSIVPLVLSPPYLISARSSEALFPPSLPRHLLSLLPPQKPVISKNIAVHNDKANDATISKGKLPVNLNASTINGNGPAKRASTNPYLTMPPMNMKIDVRKWSWLTFGMSGNGHVRKTEDPARSNDADGKPNDVTTDATAPTQPVKDKAANETSSRTPSQGELDPTALADALATEHEATLPIHYVQRPPDVIDDLIPTPSNVSASPNDSAGSSLPTDNALTTLPAEPTSFQHSHSMPLDASRSTPESHSSADASNGDVTSSAPPLSPPSPNPQPPVEHLDNSDSSSKPPPPPTHHQPPPVFSQIFLHFPDGEPSGSRTLRKKVHYTNYDGLLFALVPPPDDDGDDYEIGNEAVDVLSEKVGRLLTSLKEITRREEGSLAVTFASSTVKNVLQKMQHVVSTPDGLSYSTSSFDDTSRCLYEAQRLLDIDSDVSEVFSRGQNPQDWHLAKKGLGSSNETGTVYMQIARKEASLTDVDNELSGVLRRFLES
ncbi:hypothetical protein BD410DRAFT_786836, partial [Rickenella mellea]